MSTLEKFRLDHKVIVITGGAGLLGRQHAEAVLDAGGIAILLDITADALENAVSELGKKYNEDRIVGMLADITSLESLEKVRDVILSKYQSIDGLINNAANNPKIEGNVANMAAIQFENFPMQMWMNDIAVGLTGAFLCSQIFGAAMAKQGRGVILNISSDLGIIAPDQRIYRKEGLKEEEQTIKPVTYSVIKHGLIGLTKYLATYYAKKGVRCNALCPAGVFNGQDDEFLKKLTNLVPMGRMADKEEYKSTILYMLSDASSYMTGSTVVVDGGRTCW
jgi:NAD(P)-dependent dehydrogenase (short-subunit alcohol dehydrogenase family)